ncbi:MAG: C-terminal binding protein [Planctomycetaceae bacterium]|nr:C-terminal binding protein [Planctomycetaceae bacterium]
MLKAVRLNAITYPVDETERAELARAGAELFEIEGQEPDEILAAAEDCDALLVVSSRVPGSVIGRLSRCRVIARLGAGTDKIDVAEATRRGIIVSNVPDFCLNEQAEHTLALLLAFARRLPFMMEAMRTHHWSARHHPGVHRLAGQTLGLIGFGASAQAVAQRAAPFGLRLQAWVRQPNKYQDIAERLQAELVPLDRLLSESDFVSIHLPLCDETHHLLSAERLARLKPTAVLINTARGAIVDEAALVDVLRQHKIAGAALDVFEGIDVFALPGTSARHPLLELDNVLLTPHCAGSSVESSYESKVRGVRNAADVLLGIRPTHVVNDDVVPRFPLRNEPRPSRSR